MFKYLCVGLWDANIYFHIAVNPWFKMGNIKLVNCVFLLVFVCRGSLG